MPDHHLHRGTPQRTVVNCSSGLTSVIMAPGIHSVAAIGMLRARVLIFAEFLEVPPLNCLLISLCLFRSLKRYTTVQRASLEPSNLIVDYICVK